MPALSGEFTVQIGDEQLDVCLNLHAISLYLDIEGHELSELDKHLSKQPLRTLPRLVWAGVRTAAVLKGADVNMTFEQFSARFGSTDWESVSTHVGNALNLEPGKPTPRAKTKAKR